VLETIDFDQRQQLIARAPCKVRLPPDVAKLLGAGSQAVAQTNNSRAGVRYKALRRAAVQLQGGLPAFPCDGSLVGTIVQDFSRESMGILYHEQLFPEERLRLWMPSLSLEAKVIRCRRRGPQCYEIGLALDRDYALRELLA
jgi:hypothetical protein